MSLNQDFIAAAKELLGEEQFYVNEPMSRHTTFTIGGPADYLLFPSSMEQVAANAERASIKYKQVEFMHDKLGQVFDGVISGVTEWGLYVELNENKCEGLVPIRDLDDDYYEFDEKNYCLIGRRKKRQYRLGDPISIKVAQANLDRKQLDYQLVE